MDRQKLLLVAAIVTALLGLIIIAQNVSSTGSC